MLDNYPDVLTVSEVIEILGLGKNKIYELLNDGKLSGVRIGRSWRVTKQALLAFLDL